MKTVFLCYEMNPQTGLSEVAEVCDRLQLVTDFFNQSSRVHHVEEWRVNFSRHSGKEKINEFYTIKDFEERK